MTSELGDLSCHAFPASGISYSYSFYLRFWRGVEWEWCGLFWCRGQGKRYCQTLMTNPSDQMIGQAGKAGRTESSLNSSPLLSTQHLSSYHLFSSLPSTSLLSLHSKPSQTLPLHVKHTFCVFTLALTLLHINIHVLQALKLTHIYTSHPSVY